MDPGWQGLLLSGGGSQVSGVSTCQQGSSWPVLGREGLSGAWGSKWDSTVLSLPLLVSDAVLPWPLTYGAPLLPARGNGEAALTVPLCPDMGVVSAALQPEKQHFWDGQRRKDGRRAWVAPRGTGGLGTLAREPTPASPAGAGASQPIWALGFLPQAKPPANTPRGPLESSSTPGEREEDTSPGHTGLKQRRR